MGSTAVQLKIRGRVQGVGYRAWFAEQARELDLQGWVRNLDSGEVEAIVQGASSAVENLVQAAARGPMLARVESVETIPCDRDETFQGFEIRRK